MIGTPVREPRTGRPGRGVGLGLGGTAASLALLFEATADIVSRMPLISKHPRLAPVEPPHPPEVAAALDALGPPLALFRLFARRPERALAIHEWGRYYFSKRSALSLRHRELVIDRTTARLGAEYEWGVHIAAFAAKAGLGPHQIASLAGGGPADGCWDDGDQAVLGAVDALVDSADLGDELWSALVAACSEEGALELLLLCGWYHAISFVARATRLPLEPFGARFADYSDFAGPPS
jgi:alkylhydroperoxidase family enzyme